MIAAGSPGGSRSIRNTKTAAISITGSVAAGRRQIGRAPGRGKGEISGGAGSLKKKKEERGSSESLKMEGTRASRLWGGALLGYTIGVTVLSSNSVLLVRTRIATVKLGGHTSSRHC